jgi:hypothetical protein
MPNLSKPQLTRLQILYAQFAAHSLDLGKEREARIAWASEQLGHPVASFKDLSKADAHTLIDRLQGALGIAPSKPRRRARRDDHAAGTEGRRAPAAGNGALPDSRGQVRTIATAEDVERIQNALQRLGWTQGQYEAWLRSARSPLARKVGGTRIAPTDITLRTLHDTNRVWWALKGILKARGLWKG